MYTENTDILEKNDYVASRQSADVSNFPIGHIPKDQFFEKELPAPPRGVGNTVEEDVYPDGGLRAWLVVFGVSVTPPPSMTCISLNGSW